LHSLNVAKCQVKLQYYLCHFLELFFSTSFHNLSVHIAYYSNQKVKENEHICYH
jgi:hypothetical protein